MSLGKEAVKKMQQRASCRIFQEKSIPEDILKEILSTGLRAASGGNLQPYSIIVVRDKEKNQKLAELCGSQKFMADASVNLIFLLDWYKLFRFCKLEKAPFTAAKSYMHFIIGLEDVVCCAQSIETAAWQLGVGSVYIGTVNRAGREIAELYNLPRYTYPVLILTLGYPKGELKLRPRLPYELMVFDEKYPDLTDEEILKGFSAKYGNNLRSLPSDENDKSAWIERLERALLTSYSQEEVKEIIDEILKLEGLNYIQYVFGLHYHASDMLNLGKEIMEMLKEQGLEPFYMLFENKYLDEIEKNK